MKNISAASLIIAYIFTALPAFADDHSPEVEARVHSIQQDMRADLREGRTEHARNTLEQAVGNFHAVEIELGLIQTLMQAGEYRHALSAAAHTQAEHPKLADSALFYAWLLAIGGQTNPAIQLLENTQTLLPDNDALAVMLQQIKTNKLASTEIKTSDAIQLKPFTSTKSNIQGAQKYLTSGVVIGDGKKIITVLSAIENAKTISVRDGLGRTATAQIEQKIPSAQLAILKLDTPIKPPPNINLADKPPFPGTPIYLIGFAASSNNQADWPQLKIDILGTPGASNTYGYPVHVRTAPKGSGIYNQQGNLIGILAGDDKKIMLPLTDDALTVYKKSSKNSLAKLPMDEIYEASLSSTVQVFGSD